MQPAIMRRANAPLRTGQTKGVKNMTEQKPIGVPSLPGMRIDVDSKGSGKPALQVDIEHYKKMLDVPGLSEAQKEQAIEALWTIVTHFVALGFGVDPVSQACGQPEDQCGTPDSDVLSLDHSNQTDQNTNAASDPASSAERKEES